MKALVILVIALPRMEETEATSAFMCPVSGDEHQAKDALKSFYGDKRKKRTKESRVSILQSSLY